MSLITVDHSGNINRIIEILQANSTIYSSSNPKDKLRKIFFAETNYDREDDATPYCYVQIADDYEFNKEPYGTSQPNFYQTTVAYNVVIVVQQKEISLTQQQIFYFQNLVVQQLKNFPTLDDPNNPGNPIAARSNIMSQNRLMQKKGMEKDGVKIVIQYQIGSLGQVTFPSPIGVLNLFSKPLDDDDINLDRDLLDDASFALTPKDKPGKVSFEVELTTTIDPQIKTMKDAGAEISVSYNWNGVGRTRTLVISALHSPAPYDNIPKLVIECELVQ